MALPCTWLTTEVAASKANSQIFSHIKKTILLDVPLLDAIYFTVDLNKHKVLVRSPFLCLLKLHKYALTYDGQTAFSLYVITVTVSHYCQTSATDTLPPPS